MILIFLYIHFFLSQPKTKTKNIYLYKYFTIRHVTQHFRNIYFILREDIGERFQDKWEQFPILSAKGSCECEKANQNALAHCFQCHA